MILNRSQPETEQRSHRGIAGLLARYLSEERTYHLDLLQLIRRLSAGALTPVLQETMAEMQQRRESITSLREELLQRFESETEPHAETPTLTEIAAQIEASAQTEMLTQTQDVRRLIIQTRVAADRLGSRLSLMHQCLEEVLTGRPAAKTTSYDREGRLQSLPSNRSLMTRHG